MDHVGDAEGIDLRRLAAIVHRLRPILLTAGIDLVNRNDFAWFLARSADHCLVLETPPGGRVAAKGFAL
jgi:hypothetical protein